MDPLSTSVGALSAALTTALGGLIWVVRQRGVAIALPDSADEVRKLVSQIEAAVASQGAAVINLKEGLLSTTTMQAETQRRQVDLLSHIATLIEVQGTKMDELVARSRREEQQAPPRG